MNIVAAPPLPRAAFFILFALAGSDKHGYAIMREARDISEGRFELGPATLYTTIQRLLESTWIEEAEPPQSKDGRRRYYRLTQQGYSVLRNELKQMESIVRKSKTLALSDGEIA